MSDDLINSIPFPNAEFYDKTLPRSRMKEIDDLILSHGFDPKDFRWESDVSSKFQRPDVRFSRLVHASKPDYYFKFNSTREGVMFFTRSPGVNSKMEDGQTGDWPYQLTAAREWLVALKAELGPTDSTFSGELDELVGLYRRIVLDRDLLNLIAESEEVGNPLAVVMIDIDKFKRVNDSHGHPAGDEVLKFVANTIKRTTGSKGKSYRYGGEELAIILPNYSAEEAAALSERIRKEIEAGTIGVEEISVTASFGIAELPRHGTTAEALIKAADKCFIFREESRTQFSPNQWGA
jgi:diguanylate cyclase (GGDEF)-like protein